MENLKEKLLSLGVFLDNEYLDFYCTLVYSNKDTIRKKFITQKHHIIPKTYYKLNNIEIDNSENNIVNLLYKDHILAHYYLCLCCSNKQLKGKLCNAFFHLTNRKYKLESFNPDTDLDQFSELYDFYVQNKRDINNLCNEVVCVELDKTFKNISYANEYVGKKRYTTRIWEVINNKTYYAYGYHWCLLKDTDILSELKRKYLNKDRGIIHFKDKIYCFELNKIFNCGKEAKDYFIKKFNIKICPYAKKNVVRKTRGYHFCYLSDKDNVNFNDILLKEKRKERVGKKVLCEETGIVYISVDSAIKHTGISSIHSACKGVYKQAGGFHWRYIE